MAVRSYLKPKYDLDAFFGARDYFPDGSCVSQCVALVLERRALPVPSMKEIDVDLGLRLPAFMRDDDDHALLAGPEVVCYGTQIDKPEYGLQQFFDKHGLPLTEQYYSLESAGDISSFLHRELRFGHDVLFCYENSVFPGRGSEGGHGSLIFGVREDCVVVADPNYDERVYISLDVLVDSVRVHRDGVVDFGGFWVIS